MPQDLLTLFRIYTIIFFQEASPWPKPWKNVFMLLTEIVQIAVASYFQEQSVACTCHSDAGSHTDAVAVEDDDDVAAAVVAA